MPSLRRPAAAGRFYPGGARELSDLVDALLRESPSETPQGTALGALVPHAGYAYSGRVAARAYRALKGLQVETAVVIGSAHFGRAPGLEVDDHEAYSTPLGTVPVDLELAEALRKAHPGVRLSPEAHEREHSVETQIPFLQRLFPSVKVLPIVTSVSRFEEAAELGRALARTLKGRRAVVLAASDLSHYPAAEDARRVDPASLESCASLHPDLFWKAAELLMEFGVPELRCTWCGKGAVAVTLHALLAMGTDRARVLAYANSADAGGDPGRAVGYGAVVFLRGGTERPAFRVPLEPQERRELLALARRALAIYLKTGAQPEPVLFDNPRFNVPSGVFVTWRVRGQQGMELRGCVGTPYPGRTLGNAVCRFAVESARADTRFAPVTPEELPRLAGEISVLSPMRTARLDEIRPGLGVVIGLGLSRGLFLPSVWKKFKTKEAFLSALAEHKAGLAKDAWKSPEAQFQVFETDSFEEEQGPPPGSPPPDA
ncbi:MAG: AmmeMemoRadiSam system protein B [Elusimicrobiota bacterium]